MSSKEQKSPVADFETNEIELYSLILFNDEVNTFDFVVDTLIDVCEHDAMQAENCAWIAHFKGKCKVKNGPLSDLKPRYEEMTNRKLTVEIK